MRLISAVLSLAVLSTTALGAGGGGEHPRLLVSKADLPALRARVKTEPYASMLKAAEKEAGLADGGNADAAKSLMYNMAPRHQAGLYLITGDKRYAAAAEKICLEMVADKEFWNNPGSKGLTRAAGALTVALAYDACYDAWPASTRTTISAKLREAANGLMKSMGAGANNGVANNWQAVRWGAAGTAALASDDGDGTATARECMGNMKRHLSANLGDNGWNPEGIGYTQYPWQFTGPFGLAAFRAGVGDLRTEVKKASLTHWTSLAGTVAIPKGPAGTERGMHGDLSDDNVGWTGEGVVEMSFFFAPKEQVPAIKWMYDHLCGAEGDKSFDPANGGSIYGCLLYPPLQDVAAKNPAEVIGLNYTDKSHGIAIFRNAFKDENDIVVLVNAHSRQPQGAHGGPDTNTYRILGLGSLWATGCGRGGEIGGQTNLFGSDPSNFKAKKTPKGSPPPLGKLVSAEFLKDGGGTCVTTGSCLGVDNHKRTLAVDFSGKSGAAAVIIDANTSDDGKFWRLNTPEFNTVKVEGSTFLLTAPTGATLAGTVVEPAGAKLRTGTIRRDNPRDSHGVGITYRGQKYQNNNWVDFECAHNALVVMTLQKGPAPKVTGQTIDGTLKVGNQSLTISAGKIGG